MSDQCTRLPNGGLVSFMIAGAQKSGTTAIADYLRMHPKIFIPSGKEMHFFDRDQNFVSEKPDYSRYHAAFCGMKTGQVAGDATPRYLYWQECAERIQAYNAGMRLVFILRSPVDRAYSHWHMQRQRGRESLTFGQAIRTEPERLASIGHSRARGWYAYLERGNYCDQIQQYIDRFPRRNLYFLKSEQLKSEHSKTLTSLCNFLGIPVFDPMPESHLSFSQEYDEMDRADRDYLREYFRHGIHKLEQMLEWNCSPWIS